MWGVDRLFLQFEEGHAVRVPVSWTSLAAPDPWVSLSAGQVRLRVGDLLRLVDLLDQLEGNRGPR